MSQNEWPVLTCARTVLLPLAEFILKKCEIKILPYVVQLHSRNAAHFLIITIFKAN